jgi:predicted MFS family arabinose efflux permease
MNNGDKRYLGTRWLSLAVVLGVALGTAIGKLMGNMRTGLMIGLILAVCVWTVLTQKGAKEAAFSEKENVSDETATDSDKESAGQ